MVASPSSARETRSATQSNASPTSPTTAYSSMNEAIFFSSCSGEYLDVDASPSPLAAAAAASALASALAFASRRMLASSAARFSAVGMTAARAGAS